MIDRFEFFHGLVFARILHGMQRALTIRPFDSVSNASYVIHESIGIYIKYSSKRLTPWRFTFKKEHQEEIDLLKTKFQRFFLVLVCNNDGVVCLSYADLEALFNKDHEPLEWISVTRHKREMYAVKGSNGALGFKIGQNDFPNKIFSQTPP